MKEIIDLGQWQRIQNLLSEVIGANLCLFDYQMPAPLTHSHTTPYCFALEQSLAPDAAVRPKDCAVEAFHRKKDNGENSYTCTHGLSYFMTDICSEDRTVGMLVLGPVLIGKRSPDFLYHQICQERSLDPEIFCDRIREIKVFSHRGVKVACDFLEEMARCIVDLSGKSRKLEEMIPRFSASAAGDFQEAYSDQIANEFLDTAMETVSADSGSFLLRDSVENCLYFKAIRGLRSDVMMSAKIPVDGSVSGWVLDKKEAVLLADEPVEAELKKRLTRPEIHSSMLIPIKVREESAALLCLNASLENPKFNHENLQRLKQLADLAGIVFSKMKTE